MTLLQKGVQTFRFARLWWGKPKGLHSKIPFLQGSRYIT